MTSENLNRRPVVAAAITASGLMLILGLTYRIVAAQLPTPVNATPIDSNALNGFPLQIGDWTGEDIPMDLEVVRRTGADAHINRHYSRGNGLDSVVLYAACGANVYHLLSHRPEICYVGSGWTLVDRSLVTLPADYRPKRQCTILEFSRSGLHAERLLVLDYFIADGIHCRDYSTARSKAGYRLAEVRYVIQVQIVAAVALNVSMDATKKMVSDFARDSAPLIKGLSDHLINPPDSSEFHKTRMRR